VTAIGKLDGEIFVAEQLLTKCPSKYEAEKK
jgi:cytochrome c-type biogenesis protein CcmE